MENLKTLSQVVNAANKDIAYFGNTEKQIEIDLMKKFTGHKQPLYFFLLQFFVWQGDKIALWKTTQSSVIVLDISDLSVSPDVRRTTKTFGLPVF